MTALARVQIFCFRYPLERPLETVFGPVNSRPALIFRIEDEEGAFGFGESWCNFPVPGAEYRARLAAAVMPNAMIGLLSDKPERVFTTVRERLNTIALQAGEPGPVDQISAGIDIAMHDLAARRRNIPLARLLGGELRPLRPYASGIGPGDHDRLVQAGLAAGYDAFKLRVGFGQASDLTAIAITRAAIGEHMDLMIDANQSWRLDEARAIAEALGSIDLTWMEEPIAVDRPPTEWAQLALFSKVPLAGGENISGHKRFDEVIRARHLTVIQPDICKWGGLSEGRVVAKAIVAAGRRYCPHYLGGGIGLAASAHLLSAAGGDGLLEVDANDNGLREGLAGPLLPLHEGRIHLPDAPGLGYVPDISSLSEFLTEQYDERIAA